MNRISDSIPISRAKLFQIGWNYSQDGPGNRLVLHFQGCNFNCPWCSNPEGRSPRGELFVRPELLSPEVCPHNAVTEDGLNRETCGTCAGKECLDINRNQGIRLTARDYAVEELVNMAMESRPMFFDGGGVTVTGGEAALQFRTLETLLGELKGRGIHTALETNGSHRDLTGLLPMLDLLIFDLKHWDFSIAEPVLGNGGRHVVDNLRAVCEADRDILVRVTVIPGFNDSNEDMAQFARLFSSLPRRGGIRFELLYYHDYGKSKWDAIGQEYGGPERKISDSEKRKHKDIFDSYELNMVET